MRCQSYKWFHDHNQWLVKLKNTEETELQLCSTSILASKNIAILTSKTYLLSKKNKGRFKFVKTKRPHKNSGWWVTISKEHLEHRDYLSNFWRHSFPKHFLDKAVLAHVKWESTGPLEGIFQSFQLYICNCNSEIEDR